MRKLQKPHTISHKKKTVRNVVNLVKSVTDDDVQTTTTKKPQIMPVWTQPEESGFV